MIENNIEIKGLAEIINSVKNELQVAQKAFQNNKEKPGFRLRKMQIEISLVAKEQEGTDGRFNLKTFSIGENIINSDINLHKVTLDFDIPEDKDNNSLRYNK
ncbi:MAG: hypothetical protein CSA29_04735 [Desulfobacterales bacterium]|nr:MAG: hypothetical protein CSA29_04735 [Desulfobacterales bacterium]